MRREFLALHCLQLATMRSTYLAFARLAKVVPLFPSYLFVAATTRGWWQARWAPGVVRLIQNTGEEPACIPDQMSTS